MITVGRQPGVVEENWVSSDGGCIKAVYDRLRHGIAVIAIQKNTNTDIGRGGIATLEKPCLYLSMKPHRLTIVKGILIHLWK